MPTEGVSIRRVLKARRELVFAAWTRADLMTRWLFPAEGWTATVSAEVKVGGRYEIAMRDADGGLHNQFGEYREIVPVSRLVFTWSSFAGPASVTTCRAGSTRRSPGD
jgi:uncharacterized protein YndB with AHSA1/START domain